jgi:hypothetical protein
MRLLFDQGAPVPLRTLLTRHEVSTVYELGWSLLENGALLRKAEAAGYEALISTDQNLRYQQNLPDRRIAIAILMTTSWPRIARYASHVIVRIDALQIAGYMEINVP